jgi:hypothetical protein
LNQVFKEATLFFLQDRIPNLATMIPAMGHINEVLTANSINQHYSPPMQAALTMGKQTLTHYHTKTDISDVYWIVIGMQLFSHLLTFLTSPQSSILTTSSDTSRMSGGPKSDVRQHMLLYKTHSRCIIRTKNILSSP